VGIEDKMRWLLRFLLALISLFYLAIGGFLLLIGAGYGVTKFSDFSSSALDFGAICLISVGGVLMLISLLGLITSCFRSYSLSYIFSFILLFLIIAQALAIILFIIFRPEVDKRMKDALQQTLPSYKPDGNLYEQGVSFFWDEYQHMFTCCGVDSYKDWGEVNEGSHVPDTCCTNVATGCGINIDWDNSVDVKQEGCFDKFWTTFGNYIEIILPVLSAIFVLQILGVCFACCLARSVQVEDCQVY